MGQTSGTTFTRLHRLQSGENQQAAEALTKVTTSCAMFVRAVANGAAHRQWVHIGGNGMFVSMGNVSLSSSAFVKLAPA